MLWIIGIEEENFLVKKSPEVRSWMRDPNNYRLEKGMTRGKSAPTAPKPSVGMIWIKPIGPRQKSDYGR